MQASISTFIDSQSISPAAQKVKEMLSTPTTNFGLAALFKNFQLIDPDYQIEEVTTLSLLTRLTYSAVSLPPSSLRN